MQFEDASSDSYRVVQLMEEMLREKWAAIDEYQRELAHRGEVAGSSRMGTGVARPRVGRRTVWVPLGGLLEKAVRAAAQLTTRKTMPFA